KASSRIGWLRLNPMASREALVTLYACWTNSQRMISRSCLRIFHDLMAESRRPSGTRPRARFQHLCVRFRYRRACGHPVGREPCVTQGAVSHQVKALEDTLGIKLFNRERQRLVITDAGREYLDIIRDALDRIAAGTERVLQRQNSGVLTVSTSPDFAAKWLVYRLGHFAEAHPGIDLRVSATMHHIDFVREEVDVAVRHGDGNWNGLEAVRLCSEQLFPVC